MPSIDGIPSLHFGSELRCRGWRQEALLRMLENTLHNGEHPEELIIYGGIGKAARNYKALRRIVELIQELDDDETLVVQSGKPVAVFKTSTHAPLVLMATSNIVGRWATQETFERLAADNKIMYGGYTAGDWQYIGSQGIVQGTYQTFMEVGRVHFGEAGLRGRLVVTGGLGGMGGAQPLAIRLAGGSGICVECDPTRLKRRIDGGYLERFTADLDEAIAWSLEAKAAGVGVAVGLLGNIAEVVVSLRDRGIVPDVVTDQTSAHDALHGYVPAGYSLEELASTRASRPEHVIQDALSSMKQHVEVMLEWRNRGAVVFEYGNNIREQARIAGLPDAMSIPGFIAEYIRPLFCRGVGPFRWISAQGSIDDIEVIDNLVAEMFPDSLAAAWIANAKDHIRYEGLPARNVWLGHGERTELALRVNECIRDGLISGPICFTRDHLDSGGSARPLRETEGMIDGSDAISDWVFLNALLNASGGADLVALHGGGGGAAGYWQSAGVTVIADGQAASRSRLRSVLTGDTGIGVLRHMDAGYDGGRGVLTETPSIRGYDETSDASSPR